MNDKTIPLCENCLGTLRMVSSTAPVGMVPQGYPIRSKNSGEIMEYLCEGCWTFRLSVNNDLTRLYEWEGPETKPPPELGHCDCDAVMLSWGCPSATGGKCVRRRRP